MIDETRQRLEIELDQAEHKAIDSLSRYKFAMFGYWAGIWVHLNRVGDFRRPNPFREFVEVAKDYKAREEDAKLLGDV